MSTTEQESSPISDADRPARRDPLHGSAGADASGSGIGAAVGSAAVGAATGAAIGTLAGPVGAVLGAATGAVVGAVGCEVAGKAIAEHVNPTVEHGYWREHFAIRPYVRAGTSYDEYAPAYQYGWETQACHQDKSFDQAESLLHREWDKAKGASKLAWEEAREAVRDSWNRISQPRSGR